jgi:hypothetical protein
VYLGAKNGIACHGCQMTLEYSINEPKILKNIKYDNKEFLIEIRTFAGISEFNFDQLTKGISFHVNGEKQFVTIVVPLKLLPESYNIFVDDEKIKYHGYINNGTHVWINIRSDTSGTISIIDEENLITQDMPALSSINQNIIVLLGALAIIVLVVTIIIIKKKLSRTSKANENNNTQNV